MGHEPRAATGHVILTTVSPLASSPTGGAERCATARGGGLRRRESGLPQPRNSIRLTGPRKGTPWGAPTHAGVAARRRPAEVSDSGQPAP